MKTGFKGTFVIPWSQTVLDGRRNAPVGSVRAGACWSWTGEALRVDGPNTVLPLGPTQAQTNIHDRAAFMVRRLMGRRGGPRPAAQDMSSTREGPLGHALSVTDGLTRWDLSLLARRDGTLLAVVRDAIPPPGVDLWVVRHSLDQAAMPPRHPSGVICFTPGTAILTRDGPRDVSELREGDWIQTKDNGLAPILWRGARRISGARLRADPDLAPVRLRAGALDSGVPDAGLLVSPDHRVVLRGARARAMWNTEEVLVAARDLIDGTTIRREPHQRDLSYIHLMLPRHEIVFANGVETESFHPAHAALGTLSDPDRTRLFAQMPELRQAPEAYGPSARRRLSRAEAAILAA
ncbi:Hint domain-containing protein [Salipiger sp. IMCC34102]|uniref:Hint domain-containing protein n=1 Tax=Salipiger sp. IMCC34102 TaxID=2510647 RepID=UPI00101D73BE|nr:Hint domain-containing protein [Salipiger sp. IMCC34102]RYH04573.1 Hint domain-containing protein [Salipiger sp. IMCC34102]